MQQWHTVSVRLNTEELAALKYLCERKKISQHKFLKDLLLEEITPIMSPDEMQPHTGIQAVGENRFVYDLETDSFTWQLDRSVQGLSILSEHVHPVFLKNLKKSIIEGIETREKARSQIPKGKVPIPKNLRKYEVEP